MSFIQHPFFSLLLIFFSPFALAAPQKIKVAVDGLVCSFCAQGILKKMNENPAIETIDVSFKDKEVNLSLKEGKDLSDDFISKAISEAGFQVVRIQRN